MEDSGALFQLSTNTFPLRQRAWVWLGLLQVLEAVITEDFFTRPEGTATDLGHRLASLAMFSGHSM